MKLSPEQLAQYFALYGTQLKDWPQELRTQAETMRDTPFFQHQLNQQLHFEMQLRERHIEPARYGLAERIINSASAARRTTQQSLAMWLQGLFAEFMLPRPAFVLPAVLIAGMLVGQVTLDTNAMNGSAIDQMLDDEGDAQ